MELKKINQNKIGDVIGLYALWLLVKPVFLVIGALGVYGWFKLTAIHTWWGYTLANIPTILIIVFISMIRIYEVYNKHIVYTGLEQQEVLFHPFVWVTPVFYAYIGIYCTLFLFRLPDSCDLMDLEEEGILGVFKNLFRIDRVLGDAPSYFYEYFIEGLRK